MRKSWTIPEFALVAICWMFGDGHSLGIGNSLPEFLKLTLVFVGWVLLIDAIRVLRGNRSYLPTLLKILGVLLAFVLCVAVVYAAYTVIPLKGFVVLAALSIFGVLFYIAREMRMIRRSEERRRASERDE